MAHYYPVIAHTEKDLKDYAKKRTVIILESTDSGAKESVKQSKLNRRKNSVFNNLTDAMLFGGLAFLPLIPIAGALKLGNHVLKKFYSGNDKHLLDEYKAINLSDGRIVLVKSKIFKQRKDTVEGLNGKSVPAKYSAKFISSSSEFERHIKSKDEFCIIAKTKIFNEVERLMKGNNSMLRDQQLVIRNGYKIIFDYSQKVVFAVKEEFDADREKIHTYEINQKVLLKF